LEKIQALLRQHAPHAEVWAYGSRVTGGGHEASDLDLAILTDPKIEQCGLPDLKEAFIESDLPISVDLLDWSHIPQEFRREIEKEYVVLQAGGCG
jgi:predicted nucleotidyltransferase